MLQWSIFYPIAKDPHHGVKMQQKLAFLFLLPFVIYVSGSGLFNLRNFLKLFKLFHPDDGKRGHFEFRNTSKGLFKQYDLSVIKCTVIFKKHLSGCFLIKNFWRGNLSSPKPLLRWSITKKCSWWSNFSERFFLFILIFS